MNSSRLIGILFIVALLSSIRSGSYLDKILDTKSFVFSNENHTSLIMGSIHLLILAGSVITIPLLFYPNLVEENQPLALGYIIARLIEGGFDIFMATIPYLLSSLARIQQESNFNYDSVGSSLISLNDSLSVLENIPYCIGALILNLLLYRTQLVPRWISIWGALGATLFLGTVPIRLLYTVPEWILAFALPLILNEIVLSIWLITKGFLN